MQINKIAVNNHGIGLDDVRREVEKYAEYQGLGKKDTLRLCLLAEEMMGMVQGIVGSFVAYFWIEGGRREGNLHLDAYVDMDTSKKEGLLSMSGSGKNMAARGIMGKIRDVVENFMLNYEEVSRYASQNGIDLFSYDEYGTMYAGMDWASKSWSLGRYRDSVEAHRMEDDGAQAWDELEKSIVAKLADDVRVGVRSNHVEVVIQKKF